MNLYSKFILLNFWDDRKIIFFYNKHKNYLQFRSGCIQEMSDKRKLLFGGSRYFCPIKVIILEKLEPFSMTCEDKSSSVTDISSSGNRSVWSFISFEAGHCFAISQNSDKLQASSGKAMRPLLPSCFSTSGYRKPLLRPSWINCEDPSKISSLIC